MKILFDVIIKNGYVIDGTGNPWFKADIGIHSERIAKIGRINVEKEAKIIDASKLVVCPGFIDMHSHSDFTLLINPKAESKIRQGITTEVIGNCGESAAPLNELMKEEIKITSLVEESGLELNWSTMGEYMSRLDRQGIAVNVAPLVGHGNIRAYVVGFDNRAPTGAELNEMKKVLAQAMKDGAFGMSTGLIYTPSCYAKIDELIELSKVVAKYGGIYTSHIRDEGDKLFDSVKEAIEIGEKAELPVEISHHKASGRANWGKVKESLKMMEEARARGIDVTCDVYPYTASSFGLSAMLPPWAHEGGTEKIVERLRDPETRERLKREMKERLNETAPQSVLIALCRKNTDFEGKTITEIAQTKNMDPFEFVFNLLVEERANVDVIRFGMCKEDVCTVMQHPVSVIGTDASARAPYGVLGKGKPHPRGYGTFPRVLGKYVREKRVLTLEDAIRKMTSLPAQKLGLRDRGLIREGIYADITVFNPEKVMDKASYTAPHQYPNGIEYVLVNGKIVIEKDKNTGTLPGKALSKHSFRNKA